MADKRTHIDQKRIDEHNRAAMKGLAAMYPELNKKGNASAPKNTGKTTKKK